MENEKENTQKIPKKLVGVKMTEKIKAVIKARATLKGLDMQVIYDEMIDGYFQKEPATKEELAMAETIVSNTASK